MSFDFFICYNQADKKEADWTGLTLEKDDRYKVFLPDWDIRAGENDVIAIENAISTAHNQKRIPRVIVILTENFINASPREMVWTFFRKLDPDGTKKRLIPLIFSAKTKHYDFPSSLNIENAIDLTKFNNDRDAEVFFLNAISEGRNKPYEKPILFSNENTSTNQSNIFSNSPITTQVNQELSYYTLGQIDRIPQADHAASIIQEVVSKKAQLTGSILLGLDQEWPEGFKYKLAYILKKEGQPIFPVDLLGEIPIGELKADTYLWKTIGEYLGGCEKNQAGVKKRLEEVRESYLFSRITTPEEIKNPHFLIEMLAAWSNLQLSESAYNHYLLFICKTDYVEQSSQSLFSFFKSLTNQSPKWREKVATLLKVRSLEKYLMPELESPRLTPDIDRWLDQHIKDHRLKIAIRLAVKKHYTDPTQGKPLMPIVTILDPLISNYRS